MKRNKTYLILSCIFLALFFFTTISILTIDVQPVGLNGTNVGLSSLNMAAFNYFGTNVLWHKITTLLGYIDVVLAALYTSTIIYQFARYRCFTKLDKSTLLFVCLSLIVLLLYVMLGKIQLNYRPVFDDGILKPSFPSCHTLLSFGIIGMIFIQVLKKFRPSTMKILFLIALIAIIIFGSLGRLLAGDHWLTDIIGGLYLGLMLVSLYYYYAEPYLNEKAKKWSHIKNSRKKQIQIELQKRSNVPRKIPAQINVSKSFYTNYHNNQIKKPKHYTTRKPARHR